MCSSDLFKKAGIFALKSEELVRRQSFATGLYLAKEAYPELSDMGRYIFARGFMNRALGNYNSIQRPVMFQGTMGVGMGLFQTYMITFMQNTVGQLESRNFASLMKTLFIQGNLFGAQSLPGFNLVSEMIGQHFSDRNVSLETGLYRAVEDLMAQTILYGLPSRLTGAGFSTRGDIQPRIPNPFNGITSTMPALAFVDSTIKAGTHLWKAATNNDGNAGRALLEALSLQNISRPIARMAEVADGTSITSRGNVIQTENQVWATQGIFARALGTRPIDDIQARQALHLNTVYGAADRENREELLQRLKTHLRAGDLNPDIVEKLGEKYFRNGGTPTGWRSAINIAVRQASIEGSKSVIGYLKPGTPFMDMVEGLDGQ